MQPRLRTLAIAAALLGALAGGAILAAQPSDAAQDQRRAVGDWLVEHVGEEDGGRVVRLTHDSDDYSVEYSLAFWRGNAGPVRSLAAGQLGCLGGNGATIASVAAEAPAAAVRSELAEHLAGCELAPEQIESALAGFERAFALAIDWARQAEALTAAEAAAIAGYGADTDANSAMDMTVPDAAVDMNATETGSVGDWGNSTDANWTADEPQ